MGRYISDGRAIVPDSRRAAATTTSGPSAHHPRVGRPHLQLHLAPCRSCRIRSRAGAGATAGVAELKKDPRATLLYFDTTSKSYVTVKGAATLIVDPVEKKKRWKDEWTGMWKDKNAGDDYLLVRVEVDTLEVVSVSLGMNNDPTTWKPVTLKIR